MYPTKKLLSPDEGLTKILIHSVKAAQVTKAALAEPTVVIIQEIEVSGSVPLSESLSKNAKISWDASRITGSELAQKEGISRLVETNQTPNQTPKETPFQKAEVTSGFDLTKVCLVLGTGCAVGTFAINLHQGNYFAWLGFPKPSSTVVVSEAEKVLLEDKHRSDFLFQEPEGNNLLPQETSCVEEVVDKRSWSQFVGWKK